MHSTLYQGTQHTTFTYMNITNIHMPMLHRDGKEYSQSDDMYICMFYILAIYVIHRSMFLVFMHLSISIPLQLYDYCNYCA